MKHFTATTTVVTVAGAPATTLVGTGKQADDGDPSNAEATFFKVVLRVCASPLGRSGYRK